MFVGPRARSMYMVILTMYMFGGLTSYTSVWSSSFSANVPITFLHGGATCNVEDSFAECRGPYTVWLAIFAAMAIPLSCVDLHEQVVVQITMFVARLVVVLLLTGTVVGGLGCNGVVFAEVAPGGLPAFSLAKVSGLSVIIPVAIYAFIFHHSIPGLSQPVKDKRGLPRMFLTAFLIITVAYASVGFLVALYFGDTVASQCSLNWRQYVGCMAKPPGYGVVDAVGMSGSVEEGVWSGRLAMDRLGAAFHSVLTTGALPPSSLLTQQAPACTDRASWSPDGTCVDWKARPLYATIISFIVLIFPALDVLSAFPLNAITLGNNLMSAVLGEAALMPPTVEEERRDAAIDGEEGEEGALLGGADGGGGGFTHGAGVADGSPRGIQLLSSKASGSSSSSGGGGVGGLHKRARSRAPTAEGAAAVTSTSLDGVGGGEADTPPKTAAAAAAAAFVTAPAAAGGVGGVRGGTGAALSAAGTTAARGALQKGRRVGGGGTREVPAAPSTDGSDDDEGAPLPSSSAYADGPHTPRRPWFLRTRRGHRYTKIGFRLLAAVPPVIVAAFVSDLGVILQFTGIVGVAIAFIVPALLRIYSSAKMRAVFSLISTLLLPPPVTSQHSTTVDGGAPAALLPSVSAALAHSHNLAVAAVESGASSHGGAPSRREIDRVCAQSKALISVGVGELLTSSPDDAALATPYTVWATRGHGAEIMLCASMVMGAYVFAQTIIDTVGGKQ